MATIRVLNNILRHKSCKYNGISSLSSLSFNIDKIILRKYSNENEKKKSEITYFDNHANESQVSTSFAEVVKENTKSVWYTSVIVAGVGITALMFYTIFRELFSEKSPNNIYSNTVDRCIKDPRIVDALGEPIKAYGEETRRGRRQRASHVVFTRDGRPHIRMQFYLQGERKKGTVHLEMREDDNGKLAYRYLLVQLEDILRTVIVLEDNRAAEIKPSFEMENSPTSSIQ
ncbi:mitochondrial import inner membrane translocase subunit Tim21 [Cotesia typhae]|uniref:mitochondrial import inner membrane translocase subunit Tim21 n=1 Tax=Cotesia typhae TaxID=2053667 RepID=UPI003D688C62